MFDPASNVYIKKVQQVNNKANYVLFPKWSAVPYRTRRIFVQSVRESTYLLVIFDGFTKFINISAVRNAKIASTLKVFRDHISYFGAPTRLITDQGGNLVYQ